MNELERKVLDAARDWTLDRNPTDPSSKRLFLAVCRAYPDELAYKENCTCGESDECDECPTRAQTEAALCAMEKELMVTS